MSKSLLCLCLCLLLAAGAVAQQPDETYYPYPREAEESVAPLLPDSLVFYRAIQSSPDLYGQITDFNLPQVAHKRRGASWGAESISAEGLELPYCYFSALRLLSAEERSRAGMASCAAHAGGAAGVREFDLADIAPLPGRYASVGFADRNYLAAVKFAANAEFSHGWSGTASIDSRTGRDLHVRGVFTDALTAGLRAAKRFGEGHVLSLLMVVPLSVRGLRSPSADEAFTLVDDNLYNPSWGYQDGKVRNSHVRREFVPLVMAVYHRPLSRATTLTTAASAEYGLQRYSALGWYDARTPLPDNYRYLPSYTGDRATADAWRRHDARYTQIDWDEMIRQNRLAAGGAVYALEERAVRLCNLRLNATATTDLGERLTLHYGLDVNLSATRSFKRMRDLLGADYIVDIDQYLIDDDTYGNMLQNNLRDPNCAIRGDDRFGYDYTLTVRDAGVRLAAEYRADRLLVDGVVALRDVAIRRRGHFEKELFPGALSYGPSRKLRFTPYTLKLRAGWALSPRHWIEASAMVAADAPEAEDLFFQPQYNNLTVSNPQSKRTLAAEINYRFTGRRLSLQMAAFAVQTLDGTQTRRYYDDMSSVFCDMALTNIGVLALGVEVAADLRLSSRWMLSLAASAGRYKYSRNPQVEVLSDVDNTLLLRAESQMGNCAVGNAPSLTGVAAVRYFGPKGWGFRTSAGYAGRRYVEPAPLRRTGRQMSQAGSTPELFDAFTRQERLSDAFTLDASVFKSFTVAGSRMTVSLMLRNLTGGRSTVYSAYESLRVQRLYAGDAALFTPHATRRLYCYSRTFYLTISYRF